MPINQVMNIRLSEILKATLAERGMGVPTLAKRTGISRQTIANWIDGQKPQNIEQVKAVADYLGMTLDEICFGVIKPKKTILEEHKHEINAGVFEVVLRRVK